MEARPDVAIWEYARDYDFMVTSEDTDYVDLIKRRGSPPKLILVQVGNAPTRDIAAALRNQHRDLIAFGQDPDRGIYELR